MKQSSEGLLSQPQTDEHVAETKGLKKATKAAQKRARHEGTEAKSYSWTLIILPFCIFRESLQGKDKWITWPLNCKINGSSLRLQKF